MLIIEPTLQKEKNGFRLQIRQYRIFWQTGTVFNVGQEQDGFTPWVLTSRRLEHWVRASAGFSRELEHYMGCFSVFTKNIPKFTKKSFLWDESAYLNKKWHLLLFSNFLRSLYIENWGAQMMLRDSMAA